MIYNSAYRELSVEEAVEEFAWMNVNYQEFKMHEIDDRYLLNILSFLCRGGGYTDFLTDDKIEALFEEAKKRGLNHRHDVKQALQLFREKMMMEALREEFDDARFH